MAEYRCNFLGRDREVQASEIFRAETSGKALEHVYRLLGEQRGHSGFDLLEDDRLIYSETRRTPPRRNHS